MGDRVEAEQGVTAAKMEQIFQFDKTIRFVYLISSEGKADAVFGRPGVSSLEPEEETNRILVRAALTYSMTTSMNRHHGRLRAAILIKDKVVLVSFMLMERIMLISAEPGFPVGRVEELGRLIDKLSIS